MTTESTTKTPSEPITIESQNELSELVAEYDVVLADFYADWCGPCQMMEPTIEKVADTTDAAIVKVDVDQFQQLAAQYGVQGVPTLVLFAGGEAEKRMVGVQSEPELVDLIDSYAN